jgi:hypothetical protein
MNDRPVPFEASVTVKEVASILGVSGETARLMLAREPGVLQIRGKGQGKRVHRRVPLSVVERLRRRLAPR